MLSGDIATLLAGRAAQVPVRGLSYQEFLVFHRLEESDESLRRYLRYGGLLHLVDLELTDRVVYEIGEKYYFEDLGLRHAVKPFVQQDIAKVLENLVYHHLRVCGWQVATGRLDRREIDFVATRQDETMYVQVAYLLADEATHAREFGNLLDIPDNYPKLVVSMDPVIGSGYKGVRHLHVREFLTTEW